MKTLKITIATALVVSLVFTSCKKDNTVQPVNTNKNTTQTGSCPTCPSTYMELTDDGDPMTTDSINTSYAKQKNFVLKDGTTLNGWIYRTKNGYYGVNGLAIDFDLNNLGLALPPYQVSFTHARVINNTNDLVNVKFPNTPLIVTTADSLNIYLAPYGYSVQHYTYPTTIVQDLQGTPGLSGAIADSIVISGPAFNKVLIGAFLYESQLRNVCFKIDQ